MATETMAERESLRRQLDLLHTIRDRIKGEPADWRDEWIDALVPLTDRIFHRLMELEGVPPYPHPIGTIEAWETWLARRQEVE